MLFYSCILYSVPTIRAVHPSEAIMYFPLFKIFPYQRHRLVINIGGKIWVTNIGGDKNLGKIYFRTTFSKNIWQKSFYSQIFQMTFYSHRQLLFKNLHPSLKIDTLFFVFFFLCLCFCFLSGFIFLQKNYKFSYDYWVGAKKGFAPILIIGGRVHRLPPRVYAYAPYSKKFWHSEKFSRFYLFPKIVSIFICENFWWLFYYKFSISPIFPVSLHSPYFAIIIVSPLL